MYKNKFILKILCLAGLFLLFTPFFLSRAFTRLLGLIFIFITSITWGLKGGIASASLATLILVIGIYFQGSSSNLINQIISIIIYCLIGLILGKGVDIFQKQKNKLEEEKNFLSTIKKD